jgi:DNA invertase Pin-like site-specific DNA recombinase
MAKVGYIYCTSHDDSLAEVKAWMSDYGCVQIVEEETAQEKLRPQWKQLLANLDRGDELVVSLSSAMQYKGYVNYPLCSSIAVSRLFV